MDASFTETPKEANDMASTMIERTVIIPDRDNDGHTLAVEQARFTGKLLDISGGYTEDTVSGVWRDDKGTLYRDKSHRYTVLSSPEQDRRIEALIPELCAACRQECILTTTQVKIVDFVTAAPVLAR